MLVLMLVLSGCTGSSDPVGNSDANDREQTPVVEPTEASSSGTPPVSASDEVVPVPVNTDATITLQPGSGCELDADDRALRGRLTLEFVNDLHLKAGFRVTRLSPTQTLGRLRAHPGFLFGTRRAIFLDPSASKMWTSARRIVSGRWAVVCY